VTYRHDGIRDALWTALQGIPGVQATREPRVTTLEGPEDQRRVDWFALVGRRGVICPRGYALALRACSRRAQP
jgi:hypothetical protein